MNQDNCHVTVTSSPDSQSYMSYFGVLERGLVSEQTVHGVRALQNCQRAGGGGSRGVIWRTPRASWGTGPLGEPLPGTGGD